MKMSNSKAFTMIELIFVIVVIGILSAIAIPKLAATRDDAIISKASATIGAVRSALATVRQKRILRGDFNQTISWSSSGVFQTTNSADKLLEYSVKQCTSGSGCWERVDARTFKFYGPGGKTCIYNLDNFRFDKNSSNCNVPNLPD